MIPKAATVLHSVAAVRKVAISGEFAVFEFHGALHFGGEVQGVGDEDEGDVLFAV